MSERPGGTAFIGFTYGGKHSIEDYHVYRTSNGDRYDHNLIPQINDKVVDVPGGDGQYYFKTNYKTRQFSIPIAFDDLDQDQFDAMKKWLNGKEIKPLVFDERTEVTYSAKVTGTPQLKYICFDDNGTNVYKGEGTIQFICYFPFGWQEDFTTWSAASSILDVDINISIGGQLPTTFVFTGTGIKEKIKIGDLEIIPGASNLTWDSKTGLVKNSDTNNVINYSGTGYGTIGTFNEGEENGNVNVSFSLNPGGQATLSWKKLYY